MARFFALALLLLIGLPAPLAAQERILQFISDVQVERNGDLIVTETIRVQAEGREIRRGILRDFPTSYQNPDGKRVVVGFSVQSVTRDGARESFTTERIANGVRIRIGSADVLLNRGPHTYVITYRTTRQLGFYQDFDELYWNATGTGWTFAIDMAEARIRLPENVQFKQTALYTGPQGARGKDAQIVEQRPGYIVFRTTRPLPARNGLTVAAAWEKGIVTPPTALDRAGWLLSDYFPHVVGGIGLLALLVYYAFAWVSVGHDPPEGTIIPLFAPPDGLSAATTRYVRLMSFDDRCFTAAVVDLGVHGYLKVTDNGSDTLMERRPGTKDIPEPERSAWHALFGSRSSLQLKQTNHQILNAAQSSLQRGLAKAYSGALFHNNHGWSIFGLLFTLLLIAAVGISVVVNYSQDEGAPIFILSFIGMIGAVIGTRLIVMSLAHRGSLVWAVIGGIIIAAVIGGGYLIAGISSGTWVDVLAAVPPVAAAGVASLAFFLLKAPTREGRRVMDGIEGFRQYLGVAEEERLQFLHPPEKTPELFEKFLPYAIALDVENAWAARFTAVLAAAAAAGAATSTWYSGPGQFSSDAVSFTSRMSDNLSYAIASASTAPGSSGGSGSGGGGSSGGGGGGGGGSGW